MAFENFPYALMVMCTKPHWEPKSLEQQAILGSLKKSSAVLQSDSVQKQKASSRLESQQTKWCSGTTVKMQLHCFVLSRKVEIKSHSHTTHAL